MVAQYVLFAVELSASVGNETHTLRHNMFRLLYADDLANRVMGMITHAPCINLYAEEFEVTHLNNTRSHPDNRTEFLDKWCNSLHTPLVAAATTASRKRGVRLSYSWPAGRTEGRAVRYRVAVGHR